MRQGIRQSRWPPVGRTARRKFHEALQTRQTLAAGPLKDLRQSCARRSNVPPDYFLIDSINQALQELGD
jgi:hypothetical protein